MESLLTIPEYYSNKNIFITGATGFIGKVLVEKLMRSCPNVSSIYCLIRPKKGQNAHQRLHKILNEKLFDALRIQQPDFQLKVHAVSGDISVDNIGINESDRQCLENSIHIVFHSAATVKFDEPLRLAIELNVLGVRRMVQLCKKFKQLAVFMHVSTAYANCDLECIEEHVYPPPLHPQKLISAAEWMDDEMIEMITPHLLGNKPNTYTYTKHLGEALLIEEGSDLPLAIIRPSIVTAAWKEPVAGWIDNFNGPSGLYIAAGKGLLRSVKGDGNALADLIPVDLPVNLMIAAAWYTAVAKPKQNALIYQITSGGLNPFTWGEMGGLVTTYFKRNPLDAAFRRPKCQITYNSFLHDYWVLFSHLLPAYAADFGYKLLGRKPRMVQLYSRIHKAMGTLEFFTSHQWEWTHQNTDLLKYHLSEEDKQTFYFDPRVLHWPTYIENYCLGTKRFVLKEDLSGLPAARAHLRKLRNIRYTFNAILAAILWRLLIANSQLARNSWYFVLGMVFKFVRFFHITSTITRS